MTDTDDTRSGSIAADGTGELVFLVPRGQTWTLKQVSVPPTVAGVGGSATGALYRDSTFICPFVPQVSSMGGDPPIICRQYQKVRVTWAGATPGAFIEATVYYDDGN